MVKKLLTKVDDTGIKNSSSNGGRTQNVLYVDINGIWYKLVIHSQSYESQSHIRLYSSSDKTNWLNLISGNPKRDFGIDISYKENYSSIAFDIIIKNYEGRLKKILKATYPAGNEDEKS